MRLRLAVVVDWLLDRLCTLTGHAGACWLCYRSPLRHLTWWAVDVRMDAARPQTALSGSTTYLRWPE